jgi:hypothetical protein
VIFKLHHNFSPLLVGTDYKIPDAEFSYAGLPSDKEGRKLVPKM